MQCWTCYEARRVPCRACGGECVVCRCGSVGVAGFCCAAPDYDVPVEWAQVAEAVAEPDAVPV